MRACIDQTAQKATLEKVLKSFKVLDSGGAKMNDSCIKWSKNLGLKLVFDIGMTELAGIWYPLVHQLVFTHHFQALFSIP